MFFFFSENEAYVVLNLPKFAKIPTVSMLSGSVSDVGISITGGTVTNIEIGPTSTQDSIELQLIVENKAINADHGCYRCYLEHGAKLLFDANL